MCIVIYTRVYIWNMFVIMGLYEGMRGEEREEKRMIENE
jgi:hypothetical protein